MAFATPLACIINIIIMLMSEGLMLLIGLSTGVFSDGSLPG
jgi:hypothetical protein